MDGKQRREEIINDLVTVSSAIKGSDLANKYAVSRQVIVQDIALLRAKGEKVISTSEGYMIYANTNNTFKRVFHIEHASDSIEDELHIIVDLGGKILNVIVCHPIYGDITVDMMIDSRKKVENFMKKCKKEDFVPLMALTGNKHYHTIEAENESILEDIEYALLENGYLIND